MIQQLLYLDYNATTPVDPRVAAEMQPYLVDHYGNPSSSHRLGKEARAAVDQARSRVAATLGCGTDEVIFTSGGTEANNLAIRGLVTRHGGGHVITSAIEHPAVTEVVRALEQEGLISLTIVGVDRHGLVDPDAVVQALRPDTVLVSLMLANNEVGSVQPVAEVAQRCRKQGVLVHTDAAQAVGKVPFNVASLGVDLLSVAGHKLYAPKGIGALFRRRGVEIEPLIRGAGHEGGMRPGTENVLALVGLGRACGLVQQELAVELPRIGKLRDRLQQQLEQLVPGLVVNGPPVRRLPNTTSVSFPGVDAARLLKRLADRLAASAGAACHAGAVTMSPVLRAMGVSDEVARGTVRLSLGRFTTAEQVDAGAALLAETASALGKS